MESAVVEETEMETLRFVCLAVKTKILAAEVLFESLDGFEG